MSSAGAVAPLENPRPAVVATAPRDLTPSLVAATSPGADAPAARTTSEPGPQTDVGPNATPSPRQPQLPTVVVRHSDTLWGLAERHLGAGTRYSEIAHLNYGRTQPDGQHLTSSHWIHPGWILRLPADASTTDPALATVRGQGNGEHASVVVHPGDTLWDIAETDLGDPNRYPEIVALNTGRLQPDGRTLTDPNVILPGWSLRLPGAEPHPEPGADVRTGSGTPQPGERPTPTPTPTPSTAIQTPTATRAPSGDASTPATPSAASDPDADGRTPSTAPTAAATPANPVTSPARAQPTSVGDAIPALPALVLGLGGLAAAGLIHELRLRRRRQQRQRRTGQRIPLPAPDPATIEQRLRAAHDPDAEARVRAALVDLAAACGAAGRELPRVAAVLVAPDRLDLILTEDDAQPVGGFRGKGPRIWRRETSTAGNDAADYPNPCPALVTIGMAGDALVLVNLEAAGVLALVGAPDPIRRVERALAVELVTSPLLQDTWVCLGPHLDDLAAVVDVVRARAVDDGAQATRIGRAHHQEVELLWADAGVSDVLQARSRDVAADTWAPHVYVAADVEVQPRPWSGQVLVTTGPAWAGDSDTPPWTLTVTEDHVARLEPLGLDLTAQHLDPDTYQRVLDLLATADPAPQQPEATNQATVPVVLAAMPPTPPALPTALPRTVHQEPALIHGASGSVDAIDGLTPRVLVLGPVVVHGAHDDLVPNRRRRLTELVTYLALHPGATYHQVDEAMWPGARVSTGTRNALVSRARRWLGNTPNGEPYLAVVAADGDYRLHPEVGCDWHDFVRLARHGLEGEAVDAGMLAQALGLIRGRPFLGVDPRDYAWAEADTQQMISTIVDVAHALAGLRLAEGDHRGAQDAATHGLQAEPCSEALHRDALRAASARGDRAEVTRLADRLHAQVERLDPDGGPDDETVELLTLLGYQRT
jgi:nucleoid-associated protein YgaU/DNA-binding SARP family transcriptional activator